MPDPASTLTDHAARLQKVKEELSRHLVGFQDVLDQVLAALLAGGHVLLEGVPGIGKTLLARSLGDVFELTFRRIQLTPDLMPSDITGTNVLVAGDGAGDKSRLVFEEGPIFSHLVLADEINRATPKTQAALLECMAEGQVTVAGNTRKLPQPFFVIATQNPIEMEGTYPLPEAELDRFLFKVTVPSPSPEDLLTILERTTSAPLEPLKPVLTAAEIRELRREVRNVVASPGVSSYVVALMANLDPGRPDASPAAGGLRFGPGPRGAISLLLGAKAMALLAGRADVSYDDVARLAFPALRHRLILSFEAEAEGRTTDAIIESVVAETDRSPQAVRRWEQKLAPNPKQKS